MVNFGPSRTAHTGRRRAMGMGSPTEGREALAWALLAAALVPPPLRRFVARSYLRQERRRDPTTHRLFSELGEHETVEEALDWLLHAERAREVLPGEVLEIVERLRYEWGPGWRDWDWARRRLLPLVHGAAERAVEERLARHIGALREEIGGTAERAVEEGLARSIGALRDRIAGLARSQSAISEQVGRLPVLEEKLGRSGQRIEGLSRYADDLHGQLALDHEAQSALQDKVRDLAGEYHGDRWLRLIGASPEDVPTTHYVPVRIYFADPVPSDAVIQETMDALVAMLERAGLEIAEEYPAESGSWFRGLVASFKALFTPGEIIGGAKKAADGLASRPGASVEKTEAEAERARAEAEKASAEAEKARAEAEKARAEAEKARAEAAKTTADACLVYVRVLGGLTDLADQVPNGTIVQAGQAALAKTSDGVAQIGVLNAEQLVRIEADPGMLRCPESISGLLSSARAEPSTAEPGADDEDADPTTEVQ